MCGVESYLRITGLVFFKRKLIVNVLGDASGLSWSAGCDVVLYLKLV